MLSPSPFTDQHALYQSLKAGENSAFAYVYKHLYRRVSSYIFTTGGSQADIKTVVHESIIALLFNLRYEKYQWREEAELMTYVVSIARHKWHEMTRKSPRVPSLDLSDMTSEKELALASDTDEVDFESRRLLVEQNMALLGEKCRQCIELFYFQQQSMQEIAARLGWASDDVAKKEKYRCLKKLRQLIGLTPWTD